jgi:hypothetical protein
MLTATDLWILGVLAVLAVMLVFALWFVSRRG